MDGWRINVRTFATLFTDLLTDTLLSLAQGRSGAFSHRGELLQPSCDYDAVLVRGGLGWLPMGYGPMQCPIWIPMRRLGILQFLSGGWLFAGERASNTPPALTYFVMNGIGMNFDRNLLWPIHIVLETSSYIILLVVVLLFIVACVTCTASLRSAWYPPTHIPGFVPSSDIMTTSIQSQIFRWPSSMGSLAARRLARQRLWQWGAPSDSIPILLQSPTISAPTMGLTSGRDRGFNT
jgi:hypothetical protein